jgi:hypothetical protein
MLLRRVWWKKATGAARDRETRLNASGEDEWWKSGREEEAAAALEVDRSAERLRVDIVGMEEPRLGCAVLSREWCLE